MSLGNHLKFKSSTSKWRELLALGSEFLSIPELQKLPLISFPLKKTTTQKYTKKSPIHSQYSQGHDRARAISKGLGTGSFSLFLRNDR